MIGPAREGVVVERAPAALQPSQHAHPRRCEQFELHGSARLLLHHHRTCPDTATADEVTDPNLFFFSPHRNRAACCRWPGRTAPDHVAVALDQNKNVWPTPVMALGPSWHLAFVPRSKPAARERLDHILNVPSLFSRLALFGQRENRCMCHRRVWPKAERRLSGDRGVNDVTDGPVVRLLPTQPGRRSAYAIDGFWLGRRRSAAARQL